MRIVAVMPILLAGLIQACTKGQAPMPDEQVQMESVSLVLYYSDGDFDFKSVGEMALLNTAELVTVHRNVIRPESKLMTNDWNGKFLSAIGKPPMAGMVALKLDRNNGVLCLAGKCAYVIAICPPLVALQVGEKCRSYSRE